MKKSIKTVLTLSLALSLVLGGCASKTAADNASVSENTEVTVTENTAAELPNVTGKWVGEACDILDSYIIKK